MILDNKGKCLIFLVIALIVSITPASAMLIHESNGNVTSNDGSMGMLEQEMNNIKFYSDLLEADLNFIKDRADDFNGNFSKWPEIVKDISKAASDAKNQSDMLKSSTDDLNNFLSMHIPLFDLEVKGFLVYNVGNLGCERDARNMAAELSRRENTHFTVNHVNTSELKQGDIILYVSQGKYPRYLTVQEIKNNSDDRHEIPHINTERLHPHEEPSPDSPLIWDMMPSIVLKGTGDKQVKIPMINTSSCIALVPTGAVDTGNTLQNTVQIQQENINEARLHVAMLRYAASVLNDDAKDIPIPDELIFFMIATGMITSAEFLPLGMIMIITGVLLSVLELIPKFEDLSKKDKVNALKKEANDLSTLASFNQADLDTFTKIEERVPHNMDITTFDGIPVVKHPELSDWKDLQFRLVKSPEHGDLLPGPGLQFLYGPYEGFTGADHFEFEFRGKNGIMGHVNVDIQVDPIPVFQIPGEA